MTNPMSLTLDTQTAELFESLPLASRLNILIGQWLKRMKNLGELKDYVESEAGFWVFECPDIVPEIEKALASQKQELIKRFGDMIGKDEVYLFNDEPKIENANSFRRRLRSKLQELEKEL